MKAAKMTRPQIKRQSVEELIALKETKDALIARIEKLDELLANAERSLISLIDQGADASQAGYTLSVRTTERRYPAWKEHFIQHLGQEAARNVLENTEPRVYRSLVVA